MPKKRRKTSRKASRRSSSETMLKDKLLTLLVVVVLAVTVANSFSLSAVNSRLDSVVSGGVIGDTQDTLREVDDQPAQPAQPTQPSQPSAPVQTAVVDGDYVKGEADAPVTIIEYSDFECTFCGRFFDQTLSLIEQNYIATGQAKLVYRHFPLSFHASAQKAAEASECAGEQGNFWDYHDTLYGTGALSIENLKQHAVDLGLDTAQFDTCLDTGKFASKVQGDIQKGAAVGVSGTPSFTINGKLLVGAQPYATFQAAIDQELGN